MASADILKLVIRVDDEATEAFNKIAESIRTQTATGTDKLSTNMATAAVDAAQLAAALIQAGRAAEGRLAGEKTAADLETAADAANRLGGGLDDAAGAAAGASDSLSAMLGGLPDEEHIERFAKLQEYLEQITRVGKNVAAIGAAFSSMGTEGLGALRGLGVVAADGAQRFAEIADAVRVLSTGQLTLVAVVRAADALGRAFTWLAQNVETAGVQFNQLHPAVQLIVRAFAGFFSVVGAVARVFDGLRKLAEVAAVKSGATGAANMGKLASAIRDLLPILDLFLRLIKGLAELMARVDRAVNGLAARFNRFAASVGGSLKIVEGLTITALGKMALSLERLASLLDKNIGKLRGFGDAAEKTARQAEQKVEDIDLLGKIGTRVGDYMNAIPLAISAAQTYGPHAMSALSDALVGADEQIANKALEKIERALRRTAAEAKGATTRIAASFALMGKNITESFLSFDAATEAFSISIRNMVSDVGKHLDGIRRRVHESASMAGLAAGIEFELQTIKAVTRATAEEMEAIAGKADQLGAETAFTTQEAAQAFVVLAKAGFNATNAISAVGPVLDMAYGNNIELYTSAELVSAALGVFGLEATEAGRVADVLSKGASLANTSVNELGLALRYSGGLARAMGMDMEETVAILDSYAQAGLRGETAGTALRSILSQLSDPASKARKALADLGIESSDYQEVMRGIAEAGASGNKAILAFGTEAGPGMRLAVEQAAAAMNDGLDSITRFNLELKSSSGYAAESAKTMGDSVSGALDEMDSAWDALLISFQTPMLGSIKDMASNLTTVINIIKSIVDFVMNSLPGLSWFITDVTVTLGFWASVIMTIGVLMLSFSPIMSMVIDKFWETTEGVTGLSRETAKAAVAQHALNGALKIGRILLTRFFLALKAVVVTLVTQFGFMLVAIELLVDAWDAISANSEQASEAADRYAKKLLKIAEARADVDKALYRRETIKLDGEDIDIGRSSLVDTLNLRQLENVRKSLAYQKELQQDAIADLVDSQSTYMNFFGDFAIASFNFITDSVGNAADWVAEKISKLAGALGVDIGVNAIAEAFEYIKRLVAEVINRITFGLGGAVVDGFGKLGGVVNSLWEKMTGKKLYTPIAERIAEQEKLAQALGKTTAEVNAITARMQALGGELAANSLLIDRTAKDWDAYFTLLQEGSLLDIEQHLRTAVAATQAHETEIKAAFTALSTGAREAFTKGLDFADLLRVDDAAVSRELAGIEQAAAQTKQRILAGDGAASALSSGFLAQLDGIRAQADKLREALKKAQDDSVTSAISTEQKRFDVQMEFAARRAAAALEELDNKRTGDGEEELSESQRAEKIKEIRLKLADEQIKIARGSRDALDKLLQDSVKKQQDYAREIERLEADIASMRRGYQDGWFDRALEKLDAEEQAAARIQEIAKLEHEYRAALAAEDFAAAEERGKRKLQMAGDLLKSAADGSTDELAAIALVKESERELLGIRERQLEIAKADKAAEAERQAALQSAMERTALGLEQLTSGKLKLQLEVVAENLDQQADELRTRFAQEEFGLPAKVEPDLSGVQESLDRAKLMLKVALQPDGTLQGEVPAFAGGGGVRGPGTGTSDSVLARLSNGEYVMRAAAVSMFGSSFFDSLNSLRLPRFAAGGLVGAPAGVPTEMVRLEWSIGGSTGGLTGDRGVHDLLSALKQFKRGM